MSGATRGTRLINLVGQRFGRWTVLAVHPERMRYGKAGQAITVLWLCRCNCGTERLVFGTNLRRGLSRSCGCLISETTRQRSKKHNQAKRGKVTRAYHCWQHMKQRCLNPNNRDYPNYGGRGITVCERWRSFENFHSDVGDPPPDKSLDRYPDRNGNYEPGNWRWATAKEQVLNRRPPKRKGRRADLAQIQKFAAALARAASGGKEATP
jgi:hypothetical protein